ncbi:hypothetical protein OG802_04570 [Streptomyces sp. NBC_00704]|uniref:hypothetical protein n=1 Tax=Streptomyces sp. NBC_00704 TaxID=2975809 RepID=UPI002E330D1E|nr:hypothetical protein [Streptomyces sp. NBC_00704]
MGTTRTRRRPPSLSGGVRRLIAASRRRGGADDAPGRTPAPRPARPPGSRPETLACAGAAAVLDPHILRPAGRLEQWSPG